MLWKWMYNRLRVSVALTTYCALGLAIVMTLWAGDYTLLGQVFALILGFFLLFGVFDGTRWLNRWIRNRWGWLNRWIRNRWGWRLF